MRKIFGNNLKELRKKNYDRQEDLAKELEVNTNMISLWENGKDYPRVEKLIKIADLYKVSIDDLLGREIGKKRRENKYQVL